MDPVRSARAQPARVALALRDRARETPDRVAAWDVSRSLTYAELDALVGALALRIAERRDVLGPCGVIPLVVGRDVGSLVAINAAIRAGVPFAPLDASLAPAALAGLLHRIDDPAVAVVAHDGLAGALPAGVAAMSALGRPGDELDPAQVDAGSMGRLLFTSGSSGEPKGVVSSWQSIDGFVDDPLLAPPPGVDDHRALGAAPMSFAAGVVTALRPALGTAVSILDPNAHDPVDLLERIDADRLNTIALVPSHIVTVLDRWPAGRRLESVRSMMAFGEPLEWSMVPVMRRLLPDTAVVVNVYGATEGGRPGIAMLIGAATPTGAGRVPLGRPIDATSIRLEPISDDPDDPVEIVACGPRVAQGYWRDPELTARVFGEDPDGTRFWRSGDLVRPDVNGLLGFVGRRDNVVKINGKLVEPSEPERVLGDQPGIRRAVVLVQPAPRGGQRLVAHVETVDDPTPDPAEVRRAVSEQVAAHLVPAVIVRHERLPITGRGKIDRQALLAADAVPWHRPSSGRAPTLNEAAVLAVAAEVLGSSGFGPDDDLWDLGLDSLGATELLSTLQDFGWQSLPESVLLEHRSAAAIAALRGRAVPSGAPIWLNTAGTGPTVLCVLGPSSDALTFRRLAQELAPDRPVGILRQFDPAAPAAPLRNVPDIAAGVRRAAEAGPVGRPAVVVGYSGSGVVAYELSRQLANDGVEVAVVLLDAPAGASTGVLMNGRDTATVALGRRLRRGARQALVRALPAGTLPQRERAFALFDLASKAAQEYVLPPSDVPVTLFRARHGGLPGLAESWREAATDVTVIDLDCDHDSILGAPHIGIVAEYIRGATGRG